MAALNASGLSDRVTSNMWNGTLFAPLDGSFGAAAKLVPELGRLKRPGAADADKLRAVVLYDQVRGLVVGARGVGGGDSRFVQRAML